MRSASSASCTGRSSGRDRTTSPAGAIGCKAPRHRWHSRQRRQCRICNLQNLKGRVGFESHPLRFPRSRSVIGSGGTLGHRATHAFGLIATWRESHPLRIPGPFVSNNLAGVVGSPGCNESEIRHNLRLAILKKLAIQPHGCSDGLMWQSAPGAKGRPDSESTIAVEGSS